MNKHVINKQIIDLKVNSEENAFGLQQQVRDAYMNNVLPLISDVLDEFAGPDEVLRIDRLELDFGILKSDQLEQQMKERVREALLKQLPGLRQKKQETGKLDFSIIETVAEGKRTRAEVMSNSFSQRELLSAYFETGVLPWWATDEIEAPDIDEIIVSLFDKEPVTTLQWLQQLAVKSPWAIRRVVMQVDKSTRKIILAAFSDKIISTIQELTKQLQLIQNGVSHYPWQNDQGDAVLFSALILPQEIAHSGPQKSNREILEMLISRLAIVYTADQQVIEKQLYAATLSGIISSRHQAATAPDMTEYFMDWEKKNPEAARFVTGSTIPALEILSENDQLSISELADVIEKSLREFGENHAAYRIRRKKVLVKNKKQTKQQSVVVEHNEKNAIETIDKNDKTKPKNDNEVSGFGNEEKYSGDLIKNKDSSVSTHPDETDDAADSIYGSDENIVKINWYKTTDDKSAPEKISGNTDFSANTEAKKAEPINSITDNIKKEAKEVTQEITPVADEKEEAGFFEEEEEEHFFYDEHPLLQKKPSAGMTRFGGLVLIAPFLPAFFAELKLIKDGKFVGEAEQYKALHLLNFLASGKTSAQEYTLLLHKLLCGIEITQPVPKSVKLSPGEKKEAMLFLDDIAEQWTSIRSTSGKALRDTFFRRNGILEKKDGAWLLRVERGGMDIMLDTLPWTISIIKAPWMQQLLQTEW
ncbi:MAG: contractile injection system tape measure protein [Bacteroidota bacterium]|nr:contractile injection system tape measure protein [Bacteroidota bacterium]